MVKRFFQVASTEKLMIVAILIDSKSWDSDLQESTFNSSSLKIQAIQIIMYTSGLSCTQNIDLLNNLGQNVISI
jgi:hypothetical protein